MFTYDLPFHNNPYYTKALRQLGHKIHSVYFSVPELNIPNARLEHDITGINSLIENLSNLPSHVKKYITMNGRFTPYAMYNKDNIDLIISILKKLYDAKCLNGIIYVDYYFLKMIGDADKDFASKIEAIPSINVYIDSIDKANSHLVYVNDAGFKRPGKIILDRSLNRRMTDLKTFAAKMKARHPDIKLEALVNEGCLYHCPYKINHDVAISLMGDRSQSGSTYLLTQLENNTFDVNKLNQEHGCIKHLNDHPSRMFEIPFIRPEDLHRYEGLFDIVKISGKIHTDEFVFTVIRAYEEQYYDDNLLDLLDATGAMRDGFYIFNDQITDNFHSMLTTCDKNCMKCKFCERVGEKSIQELKKSNKPVVCP